MSKCKKLASMGSFYWIIVLCNTICIHISFGIHFFDNDTDSSSSQKMDKLQPFGDNLLRNFTDNKSGVAFSGIFTNKTVLQREPHLAALYGTCDTLNTSIILSIRNTITQHMHTEYHTTTSNPSNGDWKVILPHTYPNGGNYSITVQCSNCQGNPRTATIYNITFGDVFFCAGQSNMKLELHFTFNKNYTFNNITQLSKYSNISLFANRPFAITDGTSTYVIPTQTG
eukprot:733099_1